MQNKDNLIIKGIKKENTAFTGPYGVQIGITGDCNFRCRFCALFSGFNKQTSPFLDGPKKITFETFKNLIDALKKLDVQQISIVGWGEPLLHPNILEMIRYVKEADIRCMLTTNASLLTEEKAEHLLESGIDIIYISLNAGSDETYKTIHQTKDNSRFSFSSVTSILKKITELKTEKKTDKPHIGIRAVICKDNFKDIKAIFKTAKEVKANSVTLQEWAFFDSSEQISLNEEELQSLLCEIQEIKTDLDNLIPSNIDAFEKRLHDLLQKTPSKRSPMKYPCYVGWTYAMIMHNGDIFPCCNCNKVMGNIYKDSFDNIWNGKTYNEFRKDTVNILNKHYNEEGCLCYRTCGSVMHNKQMYEKIQVV